jgi:hypothetical protein
MKDGKGREAPWAFRPEEFAPESRGGRGYPLT